MSCAKGSVLGCVLTEMAGADGVHSVFAMQGDLRCEGIGISKF